MWNHKQNTMATKNQTNKRESKMMGKEQVKFILNIITNKRELTDQTKNKIIILYRQK